VFPVSYELGSYISGEGIVHSHRRENHKSFIGNCFIPLFLSHQASAIFVLARFLNLILKILKRQVSAKGIYGHWSEIHNKIYGLFPFSKFRSLCSKRFIKRSRN
jgi:hypothetical protein